MKFSAKLLALCLVAPSAAFTVQGPARPATALNSQSVGPGASVGVGVPTGATYGTGGGALGAPAGAGRMQSAGDIWDEVTPVTVQGGSLQTWSFVNPAVERVQVLMKTEGRPLNANVDLWQGPDNTPQKMGIYIEDGSLRPFNAIIETPRGQNAIAIRNIAEMEFPLSACVEADMGDGSSISVTPKELAATSKPETIQGGALKTYSFSPSVASVQVLLQTTGRPLNARIELLQGPNNIKQVIELYTEDGTERPFFAIIESPGSGNVVRILNTAPLEFPLTAVVEPYMVEQIGNMDMAMTGGSKTIVF